MNFDTATLDECRDYLAECKGWKRTSYGGAIECPEWERRIPLPSGKVGLEERYCCPVPATLDSAAASLPDGWEWTSIKYKEWQP